MAEGSLCSDIQQRKGAEPLLHGSCPVAGPRRDCWRWWLVEREGAPMRRRLQKSRQSASTAGLQAADETISQRWLLGLVSLPSSLYFSPAPPAPLPAHTEAEPALYHHRGSPPTRARPQEGLPARRRAAPAPAGGGHTGSRKRCFWVVLPAGVWADGMSGPNGADLGGNPA